MTITLPQDVSALGATGKEFLFLLKKYQFTDFIKKKKKLYKYSNNIYIRKGNRWHHLTFLWLNFFFLHFLFAIIFNINSNKVLGVFFGHDMYLLV